VTDFSAISSGFGKAREKNSCRKIWISLKNVVPLQIEIK